MHAPFAAQIVATLVGFSFIVACGGGADEVSDAGSSNGSSSNTSGGGSSGANAATSASASMGGGVTSGAATTASDGVTTVAGNVTSTSGGGAGSGGAGTAGTADSTSGNGGTSSTNATTSAGTGGSTATTDGSVRWVGRVDASDPEAARFAWQGAGFVAVVSGDSVGVTLRTEGTDTVYFQSVVDGVVAERFNVDSGADQTVTLATGLGAGEHVVELYRETEGYYGVSTFLGFSSGTVLGAPASSGRLIEVVGDSISAGYGNLGVEPHPGWVADPACHWTAENSSWYLTYAALAGHALDAEVSTIARSGYGMYRDLDGNTDGVLSTVYENALGFTNTPAWSYPVQADAVVINLGTNDWSGGGDPGIPYETAYIDFIAQLRGHYPDAWIFLTIGSMLNDPELSEVTTHLANIVAELNDAGDERISTFDFGAQDLGSDGSVPSGCDWHPSTDEHARMAGILQAELEDKLGW